jgi:superfamily II DNA or RNA helicase
MGFELRVWQIKAYNVLANNNWKGIIEAATGSGKSYLGLRLIDDNVDTFKVLVVVPTVALLNQWYEKITNELHFKEEYIGRFGGGFKENRRITIAVINSVRELPTMDFEVAILDEVHHYLSEKNIQLLKRNNFLKILALSATAQREDRKSYEEFGLKVIFSYKQKEAIDDNVLCSYDIINVGVELDEEEKKKYVKHDSKIKELSKKFTSLDDIFRGPFSFDKLHMRRAINKRKEIIHNAFAKISAARDIISLRTDHKIIVFSEYIETAQSLGLMLDGLKIPYAIYHSRIKDRALLLEGFKNNAYNILITVKALDEGLDVPETDIGIIIAGTKTERQIIQRLGRILRKKETVAQIFQLYVKDTVDADYMRKRMRAVSGYRRIQWM